MENNSSLFFVLAVLPGSAAANFKGSKYLDNGEEHLKLRKQEASR